MPWKARLKMIDVALLVPLLGGSLNWPENLEYNDFGVAVVYGEWQMSDKDGRHRFSFKLACHKGIWYCATNSMNPLWGYGMPLSDCCKGFSDYVSAVVDAYQTAASHYLRKETAQGDVDFYVKNVKPNYEAWLGKPTLDVFKNGILCHT